MCNRFTMPNAFLSWWGAVPKQAMHPVFRRMADYPAAGDLLSMMIYWYCPPNGKEEGTRAHLYLEEGESVPWVVLRADTWQVETGTSEKRYRRARRLLEKMDLIEQTNRHYKNRPAIWLRLKVETFMGLWQETVSEAQASSHPRNRYFFGTDRCLDEMGKRLSPPADTELCAETETATTTATFVQEVQAPYPGEATAPAGGIGHGIRLQSDAPFRLQSEHRVRYHIDPGLRSCIPDPELKTKPTPPPGRLVCPKDRERSKTMLAELGPWKNPGLVEKLAATYPFERVRLVCVRALDQGTDPVGWAYAALKGDYDLGTLRPSELLSDFCQRHLTDDEATLVASLRALQTPDPLTPPVPLAPPTPRRTLPTLPIDEVTAKQVTAEEEDKAAEATDDEAQPLAEAEAVTVDQPEAATKTEGEAENGETEAKSDEAKDKNDEIRALAEQIWARALGDLALQLPTGTFDAWVRDSVGLTYAEGELRVGTPNPHARAWLEHRMTTQAQRAVSRLMQRSVRVVFCERKRPAPSLARDRRTDFVQAEENP